jgi:hypothetical protein
VSSVSKGDRKINRINAGPAAFVTETGKLPTQIRRCVTEAEDEINRKIR